MQNFAWERLIMALGQVVGAQTTYELAKAYALDRNAFGRPVGKFQVWRHRFADMATRIEAGRALTYNALRLVRRRARTRSKRSRWRSCTRARSPFHVADECVQIHGGYGYMMEFPARARSARLPARPHRRRNLRDHERDHRQDDGSLSAPSFADGGRGTIVAISRLSEFATPSSVSTVIGPFQRR